METFAKAAEKYIKEGNTELALANSVKLIEGKAEVSMRK
jgi:hypothetical protein